MNKNLLKYLENMNLFRVVLKSELKNPTNSNDIGSKCPIFLLISISWKGLTFTMAGEYSLNGTGKKTCVPLIVFNRTRFKKSCFISIQDEPMNMSSFDGILSDICSIMLSFRYPLLKYWFESLILTSIAFIREVVFINDGCDFFNESILELIKSKIFVSSNLRLTL